MPGTGAVARVSYRRDAAESFPEDTRHYICSYPADAAALLRHHGATGALRTACTGSWTWPSTGPQPSADGPCRPEPGSNTTSDLEPAQTGTHRQSRHQSQTQKGRLGLRLPAQSPIPIKCDCPEMGGSSIDGLIRGMLVWGIMKCWEPG